MMLIFACVVVGGQLCQQETASKQLAQLKEELNTARLKWVLIRILLKK